MAISGRPKLNGVDVDRLREYVGAVEEDASRADRHPVVVARWVGGTRAEVTSPLGGPPVYMGGDEDPSAMGMLLRTLAACDIEVIVNRAALLGIEIDDLTIEARGFFNVKRYLGLEAERGPGYQHIEYVVRLKSKNASPEQLDVLRRACEIESPVADTLQSQIPLVMKLEAS